MSCNIVSEEHLGALVRYVVNHQDRGNSMPFEWKKKDPGQPDGTDVNVCMVPRLIPSNIYGGNGHGPTVVVNEWADLFALLAETNLHSCQARYADSGTFADERPVLATRSSVNHYRELTHAEALMALRGYEYQTCECPEYYKSAGKSLIESIRSIIAERLSEKTERYIADDCWAI
jgi:hypothetical protein